MILSGKKLKVSHFAQVPCKPFEVEVKDEYEAFFLINVLANQHLFLFENNIIPDYCNVLSVSMLNEEGEWEDYFNEFEYMDWDDLENTYLSVSTDN